LNELVVHTAEKRCRKRAAFTQKRPGFNSKETYIKDFNLNELAIDAAEKG